MKAENAGGICRFHIRCGVIFNLRLLRSLLFGSERLTEGNEDNEGGILTSKDFVIRPIHTKRHLFDRRFHKNFVMPPALPPFQKKGLYRDAVRF